MYGLNAFAFIVFIAINVLAVHLCKCNERTRTKTMRGLCWILLFGNVLRYSLSPMLGNGIKIPVEFSTVAYFVVPVILLTGHRKTQSWAAYSGLMAGFFYYMNMMIAGGPIYDAYPPYDIYTSLFCHGTLYFCGFVTAGTRQYPANEGYKLVGGLAGVSTWALLLRPLAEGTERLFIYELLDGFHVKRWFPQSSWRTALPIYYLAILILVSLTMKLFFSGSRMQYRRFSALREKSAMKITT